MVFMSFDVRDSCIAGYVWSSFSMWFQCMYGIILWLFCTQFLDRLAVVMALFLRTPMNKPVFFIWDVPPIHKQIPSPQLISVYHYQSANTVDPNIFARGQRLYFLWHKQWYILAILHQR